MNIYISVRYGRKPEAEALARAFRTNGHEVTSRWVFRDQPMDYHDASYYEIGQYAQEDADDVVAADVFVALTEETDSVYGRGGRHVEFGIAIALKRPVFFVGPFENIFHYLPSCTHFITNDELIEALGVVA